MVRVKVHWEHFHLRQHLCFFWIRGRLWYINYCIVMATWNKALKQVNVWGKWPGSAWNRCMWREECSVDERENEWMISNLDWVFIVLWGSTTGSTHHCWTNALNGILSLITWNMSHFGTLIRSIRFSATNRTNTSRSTTRKLRCFLAEFLI